LELANVFLECAGRVQDPDIALVLCHEAEVSIVKAKKVSKHARNPIVRQKIAAAFIGLGRVLESQGRDDEAHSMFKDAEKLG
jgi:hypothetical protein